MQAASSADHEGVQRLVADTGGTARISTDAITGQARFVRLEPVSIAHLDARSGRPGDTAMNFLRAYGSAFGVDRADSELQPAGSTRDSMGFEHLIFRQTHLRLPVFGGELRAHFNPQGQLFAVNGVFVSGIKVDTTPALTPEEAAGRAIRAVTMQQYRKAQAASEVGDVVSVPDESFEDLTAVSTTLMIFRTGLVQGVAGSDYLAYEVEVADAAGSVREFVYVDARAGKVLDQITGIHDAKSRRAYDALGATAPGPNYPGSPFWVEGQVPFPTGNVEADNMIYASGETYDLFDFAFGRDSFDGSGATMDAIFNRGNGCPNASWNGTFISFCPGLTTDDITAHEWGHAYTDYTNNLIYQWQSGALNESYSDIWGEVVDLINGRGLDAPGGLRSDGGCSTFTGGSPDVSYRWLMGEESSLGAIRDMWNPTCAGDPGKVSDAEYECTFFDLGGVHINSGVPNHAFALMVDGGTYNGHTGTGFGLTKAAHIHWVAQNMLTLVSNFVDQADALDAACSSLTGTNLAGLTDGLPSGEIISAADCAEVSSISAAVEFRTPPSQCGFVPLLDPAAPALCDGVGAVQSVLTEDFEGGSLPAGWTASSHDVANPGTFDSPGWTVTGTLPGGASGSSAAFAPDLIAGDCAADTEAGAIALDSPAIVLPAGEVPHVAFDHWVATEAGWDGGNLKVSVNAGPWTVVPSDAYTFNPYNATINDPPNDNPLAGEEGFTGADGGSVGGSWGQSQVDLLWVANPGDTVQLRFDFGTDGCNGLIGWYVDQVDVYTCSDEDFPVCGDGVLDAGQSCDDGNTDDGDGCSSTCQIEDGWVCADPIPADTEGTNVVADESFEGGVPNADWTPASTFGGIAGFPICGPGNGCPAVPVNTGTWGVWIGGLTTGVTSSVDQSITIPATATELTVQTLRGFCSPLGPDVMHVSLDGTDIGTVTCDGTDAVFVEQTFSVAGFNDGGTHTLSIGATTTGDGSAWTNIFVDDVYLSDNVTTPAIPSVCIEKVEDLACFGGTVDFIDGIAGGWTVVDNEGGGVVWTDIPTSGIGGNFTGGTGEAASANSDAAAFVEFDTELVSNSFSLANMQSASLDYLVNYQNLAFLDFLDVDISTDGGATWTTLLSWNEDHPVGGLFAAPGEAVSLDLAAYLEESDVQVRWHYYDPNFGDWDWYAQVDDIALACVLTPPQTLKEESVVLLEGIDDGDSDSDDKRIRKAIKEIQKSLNPAYWVDDSHLDAKKGKKVFDKERKAVKELKKALDDGDSDSDSDSDSGGGLTPEEAEIAQRVIDKLVLADDQLAQIALDEAIAAVDAAGCPDDDGDSDSDSDSDSGSGPWGSSSGCRCDSARHEIAKAEKSLAKARAFAEAGICDKAISEYRKAWQAAQKAIKAVSRCS